MRYLLASILLLAAACSDDEKLPVHAVDAAAIDAPTAIDAPVPIDAALDAALDAAATCAGTTVGGHCWYRGAQGESCTTACSAHGAVDPATVSYAGSPAANDRTNQAHCQAIVAAFSGFAFTPGVDNVQDPNDFGCVDEPDKTRSELVSLNATVATSGNALVRRYCACNQ